MMTVAITGRSGCGKSTVTECFVSRGIPTVDADQLSRQILQPGSPVLEKLAERFGPDILEDGVLNRRLLADRAFATPEGKQALDAITHPAIVEGIQAAGRAARQAGSPLFVIDGAVLVGSALDGAWDRLVVVAAPYETSVQRIVLRDGIRPEMARRRLDAQLPEARLRARADVVLENDGTRDQLRQKAEALVDQLLAQAKGGAVERI
ncbi:dephospho-CoA kinase [Faecalibacterium sp. An192]|uniref:dephospho-CoA kinase n=1 Tax=Faecalibacterium sp. An192 TaxID=1965581 RepID=UPI000B3AB097|nr:dephospho-CoA kinase [Faecalibacterium sp. An192]OUP28225.1 dephospho-CoA kinase [Faecalibacterium sp. An192]